MPIKKSPHLEESLPDGGFTIQRIFVNCIIIYAFSEYVKLIQLIQSHAPDCVANKDSALI